MRYFKLKDRIKSLNDLTIMAAPDNAMGYFMHPDFYIATKTHYISEESISCIHDAWAVSLDDVIEIFEHSLPPLAEFFTSDGTKVLVDFRDLQSFTELDGFINYKGIPLHTLTFESDSSTNADDTSIEYGPSTTMRLSYTNYLRKQIASRYAYVKQDISSDDLPEVADSYLPASLIDHNFDSFATRKSYKNLNMKAISPFTASLLGIEQIDVLKLCKYLGYSEDTLKRLLLTVRSRDYTLCFVGTGGTGMNTIVWLCKIMEELGRTVSLFRKIHAFEEDDVEFSNLLRFPLNPSLSRYSNSMNKLQLFSPYAVKISRSYEAHSYFLGTTRWCPDVYETAGGEPTGTFVRENTVLYGAPDLVSRSKLSPLGRFICATHAGDTASMWLNPSQDLDIQVESYGTIQLNSFFMNQLRMAIQLLEILSSDIDLMQQDKHLFDYSFNLDATITSIDHNFDIRTNITPLET